MEPIEATMTREETIKRLREAAADFDTEAAHGIADDILCELLTSLGYGDVVEAWNKVEKWYA